MNGRAFPVVRLEVEHMKSAILHAFTEQQLSLDKDVQEAVKRFCTPENIAAIISKATDEAIRAAIETEVRQFFAHGGGRAVIKSAVEKRLTETYL